ncbi:hypothetical protein FB107DRAFT_273274 [Schizophyllum commune]
MLDSAGPSHLLKPVQDIPWDIAAEILQHAAHSDYQYALQLVHVSKDVQRLIEPIIYNSVVLDHPNRDALYARVKSFMIAVDSKSASFFARAVKNLYIHSLVPPSDAVRILSVCTGVINLVCWKDWRIRLAPLIRPMPLRSLTTHFLAFASCIPEDADPTTLPGYCATLEFLEVAYWGTRPLDTLPLPDLAPLSALREVNLRGFSRPAPRVMDVLLSPPRLQCLRVMLLQLPHIHTAGKVKYLASRAHEGASLWRNYVEGAHPHCWSL